MAYVWKKDGIEFKNPLEYNGRKIINPDEELLIAAGYQKVDAPIVNEKNIIETCTELPAASEYYVNKTYLNKSDKEFYICTNENNTYQWKSINYYNKDILDKYFIFTNNDRLETYKSTTISSKVVIKEEANIVYPTTENTNFHQTEPVLYLDSVKEIPTSFATRVDVPPDFVLPAGYTSANLQDVVYDFGAISFRARHNNSLITRMFIDCDESIITGKVLDLSGDIAVNPEELREIRNEFHIYNANGKIVTLSPSLNQGDRPIFRICTRMRNRRRF